MCSSMTNDHMLSRPVSRPDHQQTVSKNEMKTCVCSSMTSDQICHMSLLLGPVSRPELVASGHCRHLILTGADSGQSLASPGVWTALTNKRPGLQQPGQSEGRTLCPCRHLMSGQCPHVTLNILPGWRVTPVRTRGH